MRRMPPSALASPQVAERQRRPKGEDKAAAVAFAWLPAFHTRGQLINRFTK